MRPFTSAAINNCLVPCGQITINAIPRLTALTGGKLRWDTVETIETSVEDKNVVREMERTNILKEATSHEFLKLAETLGALKELERKSKRGNEAIKDNGIAVFRGFMPLSILIDSLPLWKSGKRENVSGRDRIFLHLSKKEDVTSQQIPAKLKYWLPRITEEIMVLVNVWVNPDGDGWIRCNFVIEDFLTQAEYEKRKTEFPTEVGVGFEQHANCRGDESVEEAFTIVTLSSEWLIAQYAEAVNALEARLRATYCSDAKVLKELDGITNPTFAGRA